MEQKGVDDSLILLSNKKQPLDTKTSMPKIAALLFILTFSSYLVVCLRTLTMPS